MRYLLGVLLLVSEFSSAQYFQYSQYNFAAQRVNPASIGLTRYASAGLIFRNQKTSGDLNITSNFLSLVQPLLNPSTGKPWSGIGITLHDDRSSGIFQTQEAAISYAIHVRLSRWQTFSFGMKGLYQSRRIDTEGLYTGSQYVPDRGFDPLAFNGEDLGVFRNSFKTFSAGMYWQETDRLNRVKKYFGFSFFDFNKPQDSFLDYYSQLASTLVISGGAVVFTDGDFRILPEVLLTHSASRAALNLGARWQREIGATKNKPGTLVEVLTKYVVGRSAIVGVQLHEEKFSLGLSYDFPLFYQNVGNLGAIEIGIEFREPVATRTQRIVARRKKAAQKRALANKKGQVKKEVAPTQARVSATKPVATAIQSVEITRPVKDEVLTDAYAGELTQEPLLVEKVTLHFAFEFNSSDIDEASEDFLEQLAVSLHENENLFVKIEGHTDNIGSDKFNLRLSQKRADAVKQYLHQKGIASERIVSVGKGMTNPLNENQTETDRAKNRRVELTVYYTKPVK